MREEINLTELLSFLYKRLWVIVVASFLSLTLAVIYNNYIAVPIYSASTQILVDHRSSETGSIGSGDISANIKLINTYKELITGPAILNEVKKELGTDLTITELASKINIVVPDDVQLFNVVVNDEDPIKAAELANVVSKTFQNKIIEIMRQIDNVVIVYEAVPNDQPITPNISSNIIRGFLVGFTLGLLGLLLQYFLDDTLRNIDFVTEDMEWNNLGIISEVNGNKSNYKGEVVFVPTPVSKEAANYETKSKRV